LKTTKFIKFASIILIGLSIAYGSWANPPNRPYSDPQDSGYNFKDDASPRFDGKDYPYYREMFDGPGIKPQEEGTYQNFPKGAVPVRFTLGKIKKIFEPIVPLAEREIRPQNPTQATVESVARGRVLYNNYCSACHAKDGNAANSPVAQKSIGKLAIPPTLAPFIQAFSETHFYNKIRYGSYYNTGIYQPVPGLMPSYGAQTSTQDRWDMVNYIKSPNFGKEDN